MQYSIIESTDERNLAKVFSVCATDGKGQVRYVYARFYDAPQVGGYTAESAANGLQYRLQQEAKKELSLDE